MRCRDGHICVGLTDHPDRRKAEHGDPPGWRVVRQFATEADALLWERDQLARENTCVDTGGAGWRFGYKFRMEPGTVQ